MLKKVLEGKMYGKRQVGRRNIGMLDWLGKKKYEEVIRRAQERADWRHWSPEPALGQRT